MPQDVGVPRHPLPPASLGALAVIVGLTLQEVGAALAVVLFPVAGAVGMVALRMGFSALVLLAVVRPRLRSFTVAHWRTAAAYGLVLAAMNVFFYLALERLHLGIAVTIEILGPLTLSVLAGRSWLSALWAALALAGVLLLGADHRAPLDPLGVGFALAAATCWAGYILLTERTGRRFDDFSGLAIGMSVGAVAVLPFAVVVSPGSILGVEVLLLGLAVALLSSTAPYALEMVALRRMRAPTFSVLLALAPAIAALAGLALLGQGLSWAAVAGILLVVGAAVGAVRSAARGASAGVSVAESPSEPSGGPVGKPAGQPG